MAYLYIYSRSPEWRLNVYRIVAIDAFDDEAVIKYSTAKQSHKTSTYHTRGCAEEGKLYDRNGQPVLWFNERKDDVAADIIRRWRLEMLDKRAALMEKHLASYKKERKLLMENPVNWIHDRTDRA